MGIHRFWLLLGLVLVICAVLGVIALPPRDVPDHLVATPRPVPRESQSPPKRVVAPPPVAVPTRPTRQGPAVGAGITSERAKSQAPPAVPPWLQEALAGEPGLAGERSLVTNRYGGVTRDMLNSGDLRALAEVIAANGLGEGSSPFDFDDGDGVFDPWELGLQVWQDGDLVALSLGPGRSSTFGYGIAVLPAAVGDLHALRYLDLHGNALTDLPPQLVRLGALRQLYLFRNRLSALPEGLGDLSALEVLIVSENRLERIPDSIERLSNLRRLQLSDNPLEALPEGLGELRVLEVLDVARTRSGVQTDGFDNLASILDSLVAVEEIHLTRSEVGTEVPDRLRDGSIPRVYGWTRASQ